MLFGLSSGSEVLQKRNGEIFGEIPGVHVIADYIIIVVPTEEPHDVILKIVLDGARQKDVRYDKDKIQFKVSTFDYMGNLVN